MRAKSAICVQAGPRRINAPPELLQMPPNTEAPIHDDPMTECGSHPSAEISFSRFSGVLQMARSCTNARISHVYPEIPE
jgi:hypothetical protein